MFQKTSLDMLKTSAHLQNMQLASLCSLVNRCLDYFLVMLSILCVCFVYLQKGADDSAIL